MIARNLQAVKGRILAACIAAGRPPSSVTLLAVSKKFSADAVLQAQADGQLAFGENYIAEGVSKIQAGAYRLNRSWQVGALQSTVLYYSCSALHGEGC